MLTLYALESSRSERIEQVLNHLKLPYKIELYARNPQTKLADPALKRIHPSGKSPLLRDGDTVLAESAVIIEYLVEKYGKNSDLEPHSEADKWQIRYGMVAAESNFMIAAIQLYVNSIARTRVPFGLRYAIGKVLDTIEGSYARPELQNCLRNLDETFKNNNGFFSNGHVSGADFMYHHGVELVKENNLVPKFEAEYPNIVIWMRKMDSLAERDADPGLKVEIVDHRPRE